VFATNSTEIVYSDYKDNVDTTDNTTWTKLNALGSALAWSSAVYGRNRYVAIPTGTNNVAVYSNQPFSSWASSTLPSSGNWRAVAYGKNNYVVVGDANKIAYSNDGATWATTPAALPAGTAGNWRCVTYGNPSTASARFIALCSGDNKAAYSIDGVRWVLMSNLPSTQPWENVVYGNGKFLAVANNSNVSAYSSDGTTWTSVSNTLPTTSNWIVAYGNGKFVAINNNINGSNVAAYSSDETISWTQTSMISEKTWTCLTFAAGRFTAIATDGTVSYSTDGINWVSSSQNLPTPSVGSPYSCAVALDDFDAFSSHTQTLLNSPDSRILITGGYQWDSIQNQHKPSNLTFFGIPNYTSKTITWSEGSTLPTGQLGLFSHTVNQLDNNRLLVVGGYTYNATTSATQSSSNIYLGTITANTNAITWVTATQSATAPAAAIPSLCGHTTTLMGDGRLLIIGGRTDPGNNGVITYYNNVRVCTVSSNTTSTVNNATQSGTTFPTLYKHTTIRAGTNRVIVLGGLLSNGTENKKIYNLVYGGTVAAPTIQVSLLATLPSDMNASGATTELLSPTKLYIMDKNAYTLDFEGSPIGIKITGITSGSSTVGTGTAVTYTSVNFSFINGETATDSTPIVGTGTSTGFSYTTDGVYSKYNVLSVSKLGTGLSRITFQTSFKDQRKIVMCGSARVNSENLNNLAYTVQYDRPGNGLYNPTTNYADIVTRLGSSLVATADDNCSTVTVAFFGE
jgi:hypothetical protein